MKIQGLNLKNTSKRERLRLPNKDPELIVTVSGLPYGVEETFSEMWPEPAIRFKTVQGKGEAKQVPIYDDPSRDREIEQRNVAQQAYRLYLALINDPNVEFESTPTDKDSLVALSKELQESGLNVGDVNLILSASIHVSNLDSELFDEIEQLFV